MKDYQLIVTRRSQCRNSFSEKVGKLSLLSVAYRKELSKKEHNNLNMKVQHVKGQH